MTKGTKKRGSTALIVLAVLAAAFLFGGRYAAPAPEPSSSPAVQSADMTPSAAPSGGAVSASPGQSQTGQTASPATEAPSHSPAAAGTAAANSEGQTGTAAPQSSSKPAAAVTDPAASAAPSADSSGGTAGKSCTLSVSCATVLDNLSLLDPAKLEFVPENGVILPPVKVDLSDGDSVFTVLQRALKNAGIPMEFERAPLQNSVYIEGIGNLYEQDCGELSGWMFKVNGSFPGGGCADCLLQGGDIVQWVYTCDLGKDVGNPYAAGSSS